jgi:hypothetical protein
MGDDMVRKGKHCQCQISFRWEYGVQVAIRSRKIQRRGANGVCIGMQSKMRKVTGLGTAENVADSTAFSSGIDNSRRRLGVPPVTCGARVAKVAAKRIEELEKRKKK